MRFYFIEAGQKAATKCVRVSSTATTRAVIDALVEKFHPDMRMLTTPKYSLSEVHENGGKCIRSGQSLVLGEPKTLQRKGSWQWTKNLYWFSLIGTKMIEREDFY